MSKNNEFIYLNEKTGKVYDECFQRCCTKKNDFTSLTNKQVTCISIFYRLFKNLVHPNCSMPIHSCTSLHLIKAFKEPLKRSSRIKSLCDFVCILFRIFMFKLIFIVLINYSIWVFFGSIESMQHKNRCFHCFLFIMCITLTKIRK